TTRASSAPWSWRWWCWGSWRRRRGVCGGKNPLVTAEQVCRALNQRCAAGFRRRRGTPEIRHLSEVIGYHRKRNEQATKSHKKRRPSTTALTAIPLAARDCG